MLFRSILLPESRHRVQYTHHIYKHHSARQSAYELVFLSFRRKNNGVTAFGYHYFYQSFFPPSAHTLRTIFYSLSGIAKMVPAFPAPFSLYLFFFFRHIFIHNNLVHEAICLCLLCAHKIVTLCIFCNFFNSLPSICCQNFIQFFLCL